MREAPFRRVTATLIVVVVGLSFLAAVVLPAVYEEGGTSQGADGYSVSAIGHVALVRLLQEVGVPVLLSRHDSGTRAGEEAVLLVLEPRVGEGAGGDSRFEHLETMLGKTRRALVVLPKWTTAVHKGTPWTTDLDLPPVADAQRVLEAAGFGGTVERSAERTAAEPSGEIPARPSLDRPPAQVVTGSPDHVLVRAGGSALLLELRDSATHVLLLTDPDVLSTAGLHRGENAAFVLSAIERLREGRGAVVFDETLHGYLRPPSLTRELVTPPLVFGVGHLVLVLLLVVWAANARLGSPERASPPFEPGTTHLVRTTAELLRAGGHAPAVLPRYLAGAVETARTALRAPARLEGKALDAWLDRVGARRGTTETLAAVQGAVRDAARPRVPGSRVLEAAVRVDRWRREIVDGRDGSPNAA